MKVRLLLILFLCCTVLFADEQKTNEELERQKAATKKWHNLKTRKALEQAKELGGRVSTGTAPEQDLPAKPDSLDDSLQNSQFSEPNQFVQPVSSPDISDLKIDYRYIKPKHLVGALAIAVGAALIVKLIASGRRNYAAPPPAAPPEPVQMQPQPGSPIQKNKAGDMYRNMQSIFDDVEDQADSYGFNQAATERIPQINNAAEPSQSMPESSDRFSDFASSMSGKETKFREENTVTKNPYTYQSEIEQVEPQKTNAYKAGIREYKVDENILKGLKEKLKNKTPAAGYAFKSKYLKKDGKLFLIERERNEGFVRRWKRGPTELIQYYDEYGNSKGHKVVKFSRRNFFHSNYIGPSNPKDNPEPTSLMDEAARQHDEVYKKAGAKGWQGALFSLDDRVIEADLDLAYKARAVIELAKENPEFIDPYSGLPLSHPDSRSVYQAKMVAGCFNIIVKKKQKKVRKKLKKK